MNRRIILGVLLALVLLAGVVAVGVAAYNAGVARGLAETGTQVAPRWGAGPHGFYYGAPFFFPRPFFGFGLLGCLVPLGFFFLLFVLLRGLFWGPRWGWGHGGPYGPGGKGAPPMFEEWHRRAHEPKEEPPQG